MIHMRENLFGKISLETSLVNLTIAGNRQALFFNEIQLIVSGLNPFGFVKVGFHDNP